MLWFLGFVACFTVGGAAGVLLAMPPADFQLHNSLFLVAHFHTMIISGVLFGYFAGITYWFPKIFGFKLNERLGRYAFWCWLIGFLLAFIPLYILGLMGATRRLDHYDASMGWQQLFIVAGVGILIVCLGVGFQILQFVVSIVQRKANADTTGDPWDGRTLEWSASSPPPVYNFALIPGVHGRDPFWSMKQEKMEHEKQRYIDIHVPKNTPIGIFIAAAALTGGFALIWHIWWLAALGLTGVIMSIIIRASNDHNEYVIPAEEVARIEKERYA
jgi:cytochrome o ubiquinol oxidase subunit 1